MTTASYPANGTDVDERRSLREQSTLIAAFKFCNHRCNSVALRPRRGNSVALEPEACAQWRYALSLQARLLQSIASTDVVWLTRSEAFQVEQIVVHHSTSTLMSRPHRQILVQAL